MAIEKNSSILLSTSSYRESSVLATLFSLQHGRISAVAKGTRRGDNRAVPLERGYLIEHTLYSKPHRDLHQITDCSIIDFYPGIRYNLEKTALRDLLFDILLKSLNPSDNNELLFGAVRDHLTSLDTSEASSGGLLLQTAAVLHRTAELFGFLLDLSACGICGNTFSPDETLRLSIRDGIIRCSACTAKTPSDDSYAVAASLIGLLYRSAAAPATDAPSAARCFALLRILVDYCRYHFDIRHTLSSLGFLYQLYSTQQTASHKIMSAQSASALNQTLPFKETQCQTLP